MPDSFDTDTRQPLVERLVREPPYAEAAHVALGAVVMAMLWGDASPALLVSWQIAIWAIAGARLALRRRYAGDGVPRAAVPMPLRAAVAALGLAWSLGAVVLAGRIPQDEFALLLLVICGLTAAGTSSLLADSSTYYAFLAAMLVPLMPGVFREAALRADVAAFGMVVLFGLGMAVLYQRLQSVLITSIRATVALRRGMADVESDREFLDGVIRDAPVGVVMLDGEDRITRVNAAFEHLFGFAAAESIGQPLVSLIAPPGEPLVTAIVRSHDAREPAVEVERVRRRKDGTMVRVRITASRLSHSGGILLLYADVTEEYEHARREAAASAVARIAAEAAAEQEIIEGALSAVCRTLDWDVGAVWQADADSPGLRNGVMWIHEGVHASTLETMSRETTLAPGEALVGRVWKEQRALWAPDFGASNRFPRASAARAAGLHSAVAIPLRVGGGVIGVVELFSRTPRDRDPVMLDALTSLATQIGNALERRRAEAALREARDAAEQATVAKSAFLAHMSHEIRTPLNGILGMAELLLDSNLSVEDRRAAQLIATSGESLLGVVNDILDFSKIEANQLTLDETEFDLGALVESTTDLLATNAARAETNVFIDIDSATPRWVVGDSTRLRQVLTNLLGNAIKFTPHGRVIVRVAPLDDAGRDAGRESSRGDTGDRRAIAFSVRDTGVGIPASQLASIFQPFRQGDTSTTRRFGGTGLGLTISRRLVELMGGELRVDSTVGAGSTFSFTLPLRVTSNAATPAAARLVGTAIAPTASPRVVLLAEDNPVNQEVASRMLRRRGHIVDIAHNGREAADAAERRAYDVVLMDVQMPELDGVESTLRIRERMGARAPRIVAVTASSTSEERERCFAAGMVGYLTKPYRATDLFAAVELQVDHPVDQPVKRPAGQSVERASPPATRPPLPEPIEAVREQPAIDLESLGADLKRAGIAEVAHELLDIFRQDAPGRMDAVQTAVASGRADDVERTAHAFRSPSAAIHARELATRLGSLETAGRTGDAGAWPALLAAVREEFVRALRELDALPEHWTPPDA